jgi:hypothetical protein
MYPLTNLCRSFQGQKVPAADAGQPEEVAEASLQNQTHTPQQTTVPFSVTPSGATKELYLSVGAATQMTFVSGQRNTVILSANSAKSDS